MCALTRGLGQGHTHTHRVPCCPLRVTLHGADCVGSDSVGCLCPSNSSRAGSPLKLLQHVETWLHTPACPPTSAAYPKSCRHTAALRLTEPTGFWLEASQPHRHTLSPAQVLPWHLSTGTHSQLRHQEPSNTLQNPTKSASTLDPWCTVPPTTRVAAPRQGRAQSCGASQSRGATPSQRASPSRGGPSNQRGSPSQKASQSRWASSSCAGSRNRGGFSKQRGSQIRGATPSHMGFPSRGASQSRGASPSRAGSPLPAAGVTSHDIEARHSAAHYHHQHCSHQQDLAEPPAPRLLLPAHCCRASSQERDSRMPKVRWGQPSPNTVHNKQAAQVCTRVQLDYPRPTNPFKNLTRPSNLHPSTP